MKVGPAKYCRGGELKFTHYPANGDFAIIIEREDGSKECTATVCLVASQAALIHERGVWLKGWSENEGVPQALVDAGVLTLTGGMRPTGFVNAEFGILTDEAVSEMNRQISAHERVAIAKARKNPQ